MNIKIKSSHDISRTYIKKEVISRMNKNLTDKIYAYFNLDFDPEDILLKGDIDDWTQYFQRFKCICVFVV